MTREEWLAIKNRDQSYDGQFCYAVKGSRIVCRPSCTCRTCTPDKVILFPSVQDAETAGYRPCSRCRPDLPEWGGRKKELAKAAQHIINEGYERKFSLDAIAGELYVNGSYLARVFKACTGQTLLGYHNSVRCEKAQELLTCPELSIAYISEKVGYASVSHFTRIFKKITGETPSEYRRRYLEELNAL